MKRPKGKLKMSVENQLKYSTMLQDFYSNDFNKLDKLDYSKVTNQSCERPDIIRKVKNEVI